jgi:hypothetical protein
MKSITQGYHYNTRKPLPVDDRLKGKHMETLKIFPAGVAVRILGVKVTAPAGLALS